MKVTLTTSEIVAKFGLPDTVELVIENDRKFDPDGWVSNIGRGSCCHPDGLSADTRVEVKLRSCYLLSGWAGNWSSLWKETGGDAFAIIAYRILKD